MSRRSAGQGRPWRAPLLLGAALLLGLGSGCQAFRLQIGGGIGIGADVKIPGLLHTGLSAGQFMNIGIRYDRPELSHDVEINALALHWSGRQSRGPDHPRRLVHEHACWAVVPEYTTTFDKEDALSAWDFEIGVMAVVLDIRIGFGPARLDRPPKQKPSSETSPPPTMRSPDVGAPPPLALPERSRTSDAPEPETDPLAPR